MSLLKSPASVATTMAGEDGDVCFKNIWFLSPQTRLEISQRSPYFKK